MSSTSGPAAPGRAPWRGRWPAGADGANRTVWAWVAPATAVLPHLSGRQPARPAVRGHPRAIPHQGEDDLERPAAGGADGRPDASDQERIGAGARGIRADHEPAPVARVPGSLRNPLVARPVRIGDQTHVLARGGATSSRPSTIAALRSSSASCGSRRGAGCETRSRIPPKRARSCSAVRPLPVAPVISSSLPKPRRAGRDPCARSGAQARGCPAARRRGVCSSACATAAAASAPLPASKAACSDSHQKSSGRSAWCRPRRTWPSVRCRSRIGIADLDVGREVVVEGDRDRETLSSPAVGCRLQQPRRGHDAVAASRDAATRPRTARCRARARARDPGRRAGRRCGGRPAPHPRGARTGAGSLDEERQRAAEGPREPGEMCLACGCHAKTLPYRAIGNPGAPAAIDGYTRGERLFAGLRNPRTRPKRSLCSDAGTTKSAPAFCPAVPASVLACLVALIAAAPAGATPGLPSDWQRGANFTAWWHDTYETPEAARRLEALRATGTTHVSLLTTWYMDAGDSSQVQAGSVEDTRVTPASWRSPGTRGSSACG